MKKKRIIQILVIVVVIGLLLVAYNFFFLRDDSPKPSSSSQVEREVFDAPASSSLNRTEAQALLKTLKSLEDLDLDPKLFSTEAFMRLIDFSRTIPKRQVGRPNPFAPINLKESNQSTTTPSGEGAES